MLRRSNGAQLKERPPLTLDDLARQAHFAAQGVMDSALTSADHREGVQAFRDKRRPQFAPLAQTTWRT